MLRNKIIKTWLGNGNNSILFTLPKCLSKSYGLSEPSYVVVEALENGILLRKLGEKMEVSV
jgi:hypothetical protein